ncbi:hypothetical protein T07_1146 [Trichinella nelsoni]|uniref:Uncharacterized protein n=1 Tax=Trichinella nelsoni TaxID=6336 RepID=A0A0V0S9W8_9BILA|nr:hypothetical protein T07_1146 [Trichinella nelsoni]
MQRIASIWLGNFVKLNFFSPLPLQCNNVKKKNNNKIANGCKQFSIEAELREIVACMLSIGVVLLLLLLVLLFTVAACSASVHPFQTNSGVDQFNQASAN